MGKNNGKHGKRTEYAKNVSIMRKLQNELDEEAKAAKKESRKLSSKNRERIGDEE